MKIKFKSGGRELGQFDADLLLEDDYLAVITNTSILPSKDGKCDILVISLDVQDDEKIRSRKVYLPLTNQNSYRVSEWVTGLILEHGGSYDALDIAEFVGKELVISIAHNKKNGRIYENVITPRFDVENYVSEAGEGGGENA